MTKKIESVIEYCNDCRFAKEFNEVGGNTDFILICTKQDEEDRDAAFIINRKTSSTNYRIEIPEQCPLEDYDNED